MTGLRELSLGIRKLSLLRRSGLDRKSSRSLKRKIENVGLSRFLSGRKENIFKS